MIQWHPATRDVIAKRQGNQKQQPNYAGYGCKMQKTTASLDVHEEKRNDDCLGYRYRERNDEIERP